MTTIGRAFAFYIKYWGQMAYLAEHDEEALAKAKRQHHWEETTIQIEAVRKRANEQAALLLRECGAAMKDHFEKRGCEMDRGTPEHFIERDWYVYYNLAKNGRGRKVRRAAMGAVIDCLPGGRTPSILLGLWTPTVAGVEELERLLGECPCRGRDLKGGWSPTWVFFDQVPIKLGSWNNWKQLESDGKFLVEQTRRAVRSKIDPRVVKKLLSL